MKRLFVLVLCLAMVLTLVPAMAEAADGTAGPAAGGKVVILATGGTIAGVGEEEKQPDTHREH